MKMEETMTVIVLSRKKPTDPEAGLNFDSLQERDSQRWSEPTTVTP